MEEEIEESCNCDAVLIEVNSSGMTKLPLCDELVKACDGECIQVNPGIEYPAF